MAIRKKISLMIKASYPMLPCEEPPPVVTLRCRVCCKKFTAPYTSLLENTLIE